MSFANDFPAAPALAAAKEEHPSLVELLEFYEALWRVQKAAQPGDARRLEVDARGQHQWLVEGTPLLRFEQLPVDSSTFSKLVHDLQAVIEQYNPTLIEECEEASLEVDEWLAQAKEVFEDPSLWLGQSAVLHFPALLAGLALIPYLKWAAGILGPTIEETQWRRPFCPVCGGYPDFATLGEGGGARRLLCSRCDTWWSYRRVGCPFCRNDEGQIYYADEKDQYRLYVCSSCRRYLKTLDLRRAPPEVDLRIERITTVAMDLAAQQEGYGVRAGEEVPDV